ncbi:MAG TPA: FG-GAP-like repeat-containing protein [Chthoniobacterales bacterium]|nr:FG-GAP-like repeat-containing protein [Chthoniobacterales bacterium]
MNREQRLKGLTSLLSFAAIVAAAAPLFFSSSAFADFPRADVAPPTAPTITTGWGASPFAQLPELEAPGALLYSIGSPTPEEQLYLEYINRARANPRAEGIRLAITTDAHVLSSYQYFGVNLVLFQAQLAVLPSLPPLSMNATLTTVARAHTQDMYTNHYQGHNGTDGSTPGSRIIGSGYTGNAGYSYGESVYSYAFSVFYGHAGFEVDWGGSPATGGMQFPPGHRENTHGAFRDIGIGVVLGSNQGVGPQLVTQDFGMRSDSKPLITGVVYQDRNANGFYDLGEGMGGVTVTVTGSSYYAVSASSGGYSVPVPANGTYAVTFSGAQVPSAQRTAVVTGGNNVKLDYLPTPTTARGDFNGDGNPDYLLFHSAARVTAIWNLRGSSLLGSVYGPPLPAGWAIACVADMNLDRKPDYILFNATTRRTAIWYLNNAALASTAYGPTLPVGWTLVAAADMNHDTHPDFVLFNPTTRQTATWYLNNATYLGGLSGQVLPPNWTLTDVLDFNGDGKPDLLIANSATRQTALWYLNGMTYTGGAFSPTLPPGWALMGAADFNSDGKPDFVLQHTITRQTAFWYLHGTILSGSTFAPTVPVGYSLASP